MPFPRLLKVPELPVSWPFWLWTIVVSLVMVLGLYIFRCELMAEQDFSAMVRNIALVWAGAIALGLAAWRSAVAQRQVDVAHAKAQGEQMAAVNDRYYRAVELLKADKVFIRLGGIHAIRHIAVQYPEEYEHQAVMLLMELQESRRIARQTVETEFVMENDREFSVAAIAMRNIMDNGIRLG